MREIEFRGINNENGEFVYGWYTKLQEGARIFDAIIARVDDEFTRFYIHDAKTIGQFTGLRDKNGVNIFCGDLLNIFFTSNDGEHIHDCVYRASVGQLGDIQFNFVKLLWEDMGHNQYPSSTTLCARYDTLDYEYEGNQLKLKVPDSWGENHLHRHKWKANDKSFYFEVIGNAHQHPHLLEQKK